MLRRRKAQGPTKKPKQQGPERLGRRRFLKALTAPVLAAAVAGGRAYRRRPIEHRGFELHGEPRFKERVSESLNLLAESPEYFNLVKQNASGFTPIKGAKSHWIPPKKGEKIGHIRIGTSAYKHSWSPEYALSLASFMVHEAQHAVDYYKDISGKEEERRAIHTQINFLEEMVKKHPEFGEHTKRVANDLKLQFMIDFGESFE